MKTIKKCKRCNIEFMTNKSYQLYCSKECRNPKIVHKPKICVSCGIRYIPNQPYQKYCKPICGRPKKVKISKICVSCKIKFITTNNMRKYCNRKCGSRYNRLRYIMKIKKQKIKKQKIKILTIKENIFEKIYNYDLINYGGNRIWCLIRDNFTCKRCKIKNNLTVHHKDGKGFALPPEKRNNNIDNLKTYCSKCHNVIENKDLRVENYISKNLIIKWSHIT